MGKEVAVELKNDVVFTGNKLALNVIHVLDYVLFYLYE